MEQEEKKHYVSATAIIVKEGKYLIAQRSPREKVFPNKWTVPGGKLEIKDYIHRSPDAGAQWHAVLEDLIRREVKEEVNLDIDNIAYLTSIAYIRPDKFPALVVSFMAKYKAGEVKLEENLVNHAWVNLEEAKKYDLIEGIYDELCIVDQYLRTEKMGIWKK